jgi:hypothetical protein
MWVESSAPLHSRGADEALVHGPVLGRAPEVGDALCILSPPFGPPLRTHCRSVGTLGRGAQPGGFTIGIDSLGRPPAQYRGAAVLEEGCAVRAFGARLFRARPRCNGPVQFLFKKDRAWGLVSVRGVLLNILLLGGGLAADAFFWTELLQLDFGGGDVIDRIDMQPIIVGGKAGVWQLRAVKWLPRGEWDRVLVVGSSGPVSAERVSMQIDGEVREATVYQQPDGLTQLFVRDAWAMAPESVVLLAA